MAVVIQKRIYSVFFLFFILTVESIAAVGKGGAFPHSELQINPRIMPGAINTLHLHDGHAIVVADKAVSRFELTTLSYQGVLARAPLEGLGESRIYTSAIFHRSRTIALSGWLGIDREKSASIFLYDAEKGHLKGRIRGLQGIPNKLLASPDERLVVAFLGAGFGMRVWEVDTRRLIFADGDYGGRATDGCFLADGRLAGVSQDGVLRVYDLNTKTAQRLQLDAEKRPHGVACSPDGRYLAVAYYATPLVEVYEATGWARVASREHWGQGNLVAMRWEVDGRGLLMGGTYARKEGVELSRWRPLDGGRVEVLATAGHAIVAIEVHDGDVYYATGGGQVCAVSAAASAPGRCSELLVPDLRASNASLGLSDNADSVSFQPGYEDDANMGFSYSRRVLGWASPRVAHRKPMVGPAVGRGWFNQESFRIGARDIHLDQDQRALAVASGHGVNMVGTDWSLDAYDDEGQRLWRRSTRAPVWAVNVAVGRQVVVAGLGDGTLRWYRLSDGSEIVALLPLKDRRRWIAWTPDGHYMASADIDAELELVVDRGLDRAPQVQPLRVFQTRLNRPDLVLGALDDLLSADEGTTLAVDMLSNRSEDALQGAGGEAVVAQTAVLATPASAAALRTATEHIPPSIRLDESGWRLEKDVLQVGYVLRTPRDGAVDGIRVLEDGTEISVIKPKGRAVQDAQSKQIAASHVFKVRPGVRRVALQPFNSNGSGEPLVLEIGEDKLGELPRSRLLVLAIGVSAYPQEKLRLNFAAKDALDVVEAFRLQAQRGHYDEMIARSLTDGDANRRALSEAFAWLQKEARPSDVVVVFMAGHAFRTEAHPYLFAPFDYDDRNPAETGIDHAALRSWMDGINARSLLFLDTCHAGASWQSSEQAKNTGGGFSLLSMFKGETAGDQDLVAASARGARRGTVVFAASSGAEASIESLDWGNGAFTLALLEALHGRAEGLAGQSTLTLSQLDRWLARRVVGLTRGEQTPVFVQPASVPDFELAALVQ